jgi:SAM-dependent methyltransferase
MTAKYDEIGKGYSATRKPDPRIAEMIQASLGDAISVLNVGAGTGSYEPIDRQLTAVEPSIAMIQQRKPGAALVIQASADDLPFDDKSFDASMAIMTLHHWPDKAAGLREMRRVTKGRIVLMTFDPSRRPWLTDYIPELAEIDDRQMPRMDEYESLLGPVDIQPIPIPHDCCDGFLYAFWRRPNAYLDPKIRSGSSSFWSIGSALAGIDRLKSDLESGAWNDRYRDLMLLDTYDVGYRLVVSEG